MVNKPNKQKIAVQFWNKFALKSNTKINVYYVGI